MTFTLSVIPCPIYRIEVVIGLKFLIFLQGRSTRTARTSKETSLLTACYTYLDLVSAAYVCATTRIPCGARPSSVIPHM